MSQPYSPLRLHSLSERTTLTPFNNPADMLTVDSPAMTVMTDFRKVKPVTIGKTVQVDRALDVMKNQHVRLLMVTGVDDKLCGIISAEDIMGDKAMVYSQDNGIKRASLEVEDLMVGRDQVCAISMQQLSKATIGDLIMTLKAADSHHLLVSEGRTGEQLEVRGVISASDISRQLRVSFEEIFSTKYLDDLNGMARPAAVA